MNKNLITKNWEDFELLDSGDGKKLERYGKFRIIRPETQALWSPRDVKNWTHPDASFEWLGGRGEWKTKKDFPASWELSWGKVKFTAKLSAFKHTGIFPEQEPNWVWIQNACEKLSHPEVLNLFGYTGIASIVAAQAGARVTHVDASKQSLSWMKENSVLSGLPADAVRYVFDDALKFAKREARRGAKYQGIILDPPAFGRGAKGEVWKIEEKLSELIQTMNELLSKEKGSFFILNGYAAGYSAQSFAQLVEQIFPDVKSDFGELLVEESGGGRFIPSGIYTRFTR